MGARLTGGAAPSITLKDAALGYPGRTVISGVNVSIEPGTLLAVVGPNGGGKSTLLKALAGLIAPLAGTVRVGAKLGEIGYLPQNIAFDRGFPIQVFDLVAMGLWRRFGPFGRLGREGAGEVAKALDAVGLNGAMGRPIAELSGGELQRALIARLLLQDAKIILLDEPFAAIDRASADAILSVLQNARSDRIIIASMHDLDQVRASFPLVMRAAGGAVTLGPATSMLGVAAAPAPPPDPDQIRQAGSIA